MKAFRVLNFGWWAALGGVKLLRVFVVCTSLDALWNCDCDGGKMKRAVMKVVGDEGEAGRLTKGSDFVVRNGYHKKLKYLSDEKWK